MSLVDGRIALVTKMDREEIEAESSRGPETVETYYCHSAAHSLQSSVILACILTPTVPRGAQDW